MNGFHSGTEANSKQQNTKKNQIYAHSDTHTSMQIMTD